MTTATMGYTVREEDYSEVRNEVIATLNENRDKALPPERFDWLYADNPDGAAVVWTTRNDESSQLAGFTVGLPRRIMVDGEVRHCWNCADFSIHPRFRSLGVAVKLRRAATQGVDAGRVDFLYAHPNANMQLIHQRVGHQPIGRMIRQALVLRAKPVLQERLPTHILPAILAPAADLVMRARGRDWRYRRNSEIKLVERIHFDDRFDELFQRAMSVRRVIGTRDAEYLNWRFAQNPLCKTHALLAFRHSKLVGYLLFHVEGATVNVQDALTADEPRVADDLVSGLIAYGRDATMDRISLIALEGNPILETARQFGFSARPDTSTMFGHAAADNPLRGSVLDGQNWYATVGDRDQ